MTKQDKEDRALEALIALALRQEPPPPTKKEIDEFLKHPVRLSAEDNAALKRAKPRFLRMLKQVSKAFRLAKNSKLHFP